jgi:hypothetical protein
MRFRTAHLLLAMAAVAAGCVMQRFYPWSTAQTLTYGLSVVVIGLSLAIVMLPLILLALDAVRGRSQHK